MFFYCYDMPQYIMTLAMPVSSHTFLQQVSKYCEYRTTLINKISYWQILAKNEDNRANLCLLWKVIVILTYVGMGYPGCLNLCKPFGGWCYALIPRWGLSGLFDNCTLVLLIKIAHICDVWCWLPFLLYKAMNAQCNLHKYNFVLFLQIIHSVCAYTQLLIINDENTQAIKMHFIRTDIRS